MTLFEFSNIMKVKKTYTLISVAAITAFSAFVLCVPAASAQPAGGESVIIQQYKKALTANPGDINTHYQLGIALLKEKQYQEALLNLQKVYNSSADMPSDIDINYYMGLAYAGNGDLDKAAEAYKKISDEVDIKKAKEIYELDKVFYNLGISYQKKDNANEALKAYEKSMRIAPQQALAYCRKGEILFELKDYNDALDNFKTCDERGGGGERLKKFIFSTRMAKGLAFINEKKYAEALIDFKKAAEIDPKNENAIYFQGYLRYQTGEYEEGLAVLKKLNEPRSKDITENLPSLLQNIGMELQNKGNWATAEAALKRAADLKKADPDLHYLLGINYRRKGDLASAMREIKEALRLSPAHQKATLALAIITEKLIEQHAKKGESESAKGHFNDAIKEFAEVLEIDPLNTRGLKGKQDAENKLETLRREVNKKKEEEVSSKLAEGDKALKEERYRDALLAYRYALQLDPHNHDAASGAKIAGVFTKEMAANHRKKGDKHIEAQELYLALSEYRKAVALDPDDFALQAITQNAEKQLSLLVNPLTEEAAAHEEKGDSADAIKDYDLALKLEPDNEEALIGKARTHASIVNKVNQLFQKGKEFLKNGDYFSAAENFKTAQKLTPNDPRIVAELMSISAGLSASVAGRLKEADSAMKNGNYSEAVATYEGIMAVDEKNIAAAEALAKAKKLWAEEIAGKTSSADAAYRQGKYKEAAHIYSEVLSVDKNNKYAKKMRDESRQRSDENLSALLKKAISEYNRGEAEDAAVNFKKALSLDPGNATAKRYLSMAEKPRPRRGGDSKEVEKLYLKGIELYTEGKFTEAIRQWEKVLDIEPKHEKAALNIEKAKRKLQGVMDVK